TVNVAADSATGQNFTLGAGQITITPGAITKTVGWQGSTSQVLNIKNTGDGPATVTLSERPGSTVPMVQSGAPLQRINGKFSPLSLTNVHSTTPAPPSTTPSDSPWTAIADYPTTIQDNSMAVVDGKIYSAFGYTGSADTAAAYVFDPDAGTWT